MPATGTAPSGPAATAAPTLSTTSAPSVAPTTAPTLSANTPSAAARVRVRRPDGKFGTIPADQLQAALKEGYTKAE